MLILSLIACLAASNACADTLYKSVGPNGRVVYSDRPPVEGKIEKELTFSHLPASPLPEDVIRYRRELQKSGQEDSANAPPSAGVQLFAATWCGYCRRAKAYLAQKGIAYQEYDIDTPAGKKAFARSATGTGIPLLLWQGRKVQGFSVAAYDAFFKRSGQ